MAAVVLISVIHLYIASFAPSPCHFLSFTENEIKQTSPTSSSSQQQQHQHDLASGVPASQNEVTCKRVALSHCHSEPVWLASYQLPSPLIPFALFPCWWKPHCV
ncbi:unnamed protein product [Ceratitis capitata]|uniref:(Mediterranean fruit fly) hypothetical protein n=1 Tax=Ceratitis capitata TaxID=7213 RepID=A0A811VC79_CERCA|nr:unnamed protein product [Ceratitis capitata]